MIGNVSWRDWPTIVEAGTVVAASSLLTRVLSFKTYIKMGSRAVRPVSSSDGTRVSWITDELANRLPFQAVCLQRGLALQWMLRRRGLDAVLHYGSRMRADAVEAHVWVSVGQEIMIGAPQHLTFKEVARYPALKV